MIIKLHEYQRVLLNDRYFVVEFLLLLNISFEIILEKKREIWHCPTEIYQQEISRKCPREIYAALFGEINELNSFCHHWFSS